MKTIICLVIAIAGSFWFFYGRGPRVSAPPSLRDAAAEVAVQAKAVIAEAQTAAAEAIRAQPLNAVPSSFDRIVAGEKVREQSPAAKPAATKVGGSAAYDRILRGERIVENKRATVP